MKIRSVDEFKRKFFPESYRREKEKELMKDPRKWGEHIARETTEKMKEELKNIFEEVRI